MDLLTSLSAKLNITFDLHLSGDGGFGHLEEADADAPPDEPRRNAYWTGMVGELERHVADMIVAPLSVTRQRNQAVYFTKPFMYPTFSVLMRKPTVKSTLGSFLQPFENSLWISIFFIVNGVAVFVYMVERLSPLAWLYVNGQQPLMAANLRTGFHRLLSFFSHPIECLKSSSCSGKESADAAMSLAEAMWLSWGIVLSTGAGERLPQSFSIRVFTMVWACIAMIIVASYTGNDSFSSPLFKHALNVFKLAESC